MHWDQVAGAHLGELAGRLDKAGVTDHFRAVVQELWRANVERFDPEALFDDNSSLGYTAARNVTNRMHADLRGPNGALRPTAYATWENQSTVVHVGELQIRFVKARVDRGRQPRFVSDFRWESREGRLIPAMRNCDRYSAAAIVEGLDPLFELPTSNASERIAACTDVFLVWAGDLEGRTAGWYGLPTVGSGSWLAVAPAWFDEDSLGSGWARPAEEPRDRLFSAIGEPQPRVTLKPQRAERSNG